MMFTLKLLSVLVFFRPLCSNVRAAVGWWGCPGLVGETADTVAAAAWAAWRCTDYS